MSDGVKVVWAYCPEDRSKQGKTETIPVDLAAMKVREGFASYADEKDEPKAKRSAKSAASSSAPATSTTT